MTKKRICFIWIPENKGIKLLACSLVPIFYRAQVFPLPSQGFPILLTARGCIQCCNILLDKKKTDSLLSVNRMDIRSTLAILSGHCPFSRHGDRFSFPANDFWGGGEDIFLHVSVMTPQSNRQCVGLLVVFKTQVRHLEHNEI